MSQLFTRVERRWRAWRGQAVDKEERAPRVLNRFTLRFERKDFERFYMEHHWANMSYWLWRSVLVGLIYVVSSIVLGDEIVSQVFDVRMDHYAKTTQVVDTPRWVQTQAANSTQTEEDSMWKSLRVIKVDGRMLSIPRAGFIAWHAVWCLLFLAILVIDKFKSRLPCVRLWVRIRSTLVFAVMFLDLVFSSFLNPSVSRFMTFVYAVLVRAQFVQTLCLVFVSLVAMFAAGLVDSHSFLNSVSVAEFVILNFVCVLASRQTEIHARLSLYRLWYIMTKDKAIHSGGLSGAFQKDVTEQNLAKHLLSLDELKLVPIPEDGALEEECPSCDELMIDAADIDTLNRCISDDGSVHDAPPRVPSGNQSPAPSNPGTPNSYAGSIRSGGSQAGSENRGSLMKRVFRRSRSPSVSGSKDLASGGADSDIDKLSEVGSFHSENIMPMTKLPPWLALEGIDNFKRSATGAFDVPNTWSEVTDIQRFSLRSKTYLDDKVKTSASECAFQVHQIRAYRTVTPLIHVAEKLPSLKALIQSNPRHFFLVYNRIIPVDGKNVNNVNLFVRSLAKGQDPNFDCVWDGFIKGDDQFRNQRLKYLFSPRIVPSVVANAIWMVGGEKPAIVGKGYLEQHHFTGKNYVEIDVDIRSSMSARMLCGRVCGHAKKVVFDEMLVLEAQTSEELPERPLAAWRFVKFDMDMSIIDLDETILSAPAPPPLAATRPAAAASASSSRLKPTDLHQPGSQATAPPPAVPLPARAAAATSAAALTETNWPIAL